MKSSRFVFWSLALLALWSAIMLTGCGGGSSSSSGGSPGLTLSGRAVVPAGTTVRSVTTDIAFPGAAVKVFDITTAGLTALTGTPSGTATTDTNGGYTAAGITAGHRYLVVFTKTVTANGVTKTLSLGVFVSVPTGATTSLTADADTSTTVGFNYLVQLLTSNPSALTLDLASLFNSFVQSFDTKRRNGTAPTIDLSKSCTDPASYPDATQSIAQDSLTSGTYMSATTSGSKGVLDLMYSKDMGKMKAALFVLDSAGAYYDADAFSLDVDASGNFAGTSDAGLYTIRGTLVKGAAIGTWKAVPTTGVTAEAAVTFHSALQTAGSYRSVGYLGDYTRKGQSGTQGQWFFFVDAEGRALMLAMDATKPSLSHLLTTTVIAGTVSTSGQISGEMVFPIVTGSLSGSDPAQGGTGTGSSSGGSTGGHSASGSSTVTGTLDGDNVSGTWAATGLKDGSKFNTSGTWSGIRM